MLECCKPAMEKSGLRAKERARGANFMSDCQNSRSLFLDESHPNLEREILYKRKLLTFSHSGFFFARLSGKTTFLLIYFVAFNN